MTTKQPNGEALQVFIDAGFNEFVVLQRGSKLPVAELVTDADGEPVYVMRHRRKKTIRLQKRTHRRVDASGALEAIAEGHNVGIYVPAGWVVLDFDPRHFGSEDTPAKVLSRIGFESFANLPCVLTASAPERGLHVWMRLPDGARITSKPRLYPGLDVKVNGYVVAPGAWREDTKRFYGWNVDGKPGKVPQATLSDAPHLPFALLEDLAATTLPARPGRSTQGDDREGCWTEDDLAKALALLPPDIFNFANFDEELIAKADPDAKTIIHGTSALHDCAWFRFMCAAHHATQGDGIGAFVDWCLSDPDYEAHADLIELRWNSLATQLDDNSQPITAALIERFLKAAGVPESDWPPKVSTELAFADVAEAENEEARAIVNPDETRPLALLSERAAKVSVRGDPDFIARGDWPKTTGNQNAPEPTSDPENALFALERQVGAGLVLRFNEFSGRMEIGGTPVQLSVGDVTDQTVMLLRLHLYNRYRVHWTLTHVREAMETIAYQRRYDPVSSYLASAQETWDGKPRIDTWLIEHGGAPDNAYVREVSAKAMIAAVRRVRRPGVKVDEALALISPEQGMRKSMAVQILAGAPHWFFRGFEKGRFDSDYHCDEQILGVRGRERVELLRGVWIYEIAELEGMTQADIDAVKAMFSRAKDKARGAYNRFEESVQRRAVLWATTNDRKYLRDTTGNRRWWPIEIRKPFDPAKLLQEVDQLWAEAAVREARGEQHWLSAEVETLAKQVQAEHMEENEYVDRLSELTGTIVASDLGFERVSNKAVFEHLALPTGRALGITAKRIKAAMRELGWEEVAALRLPGTDQAQRGYRRKCRRTVAAEFEGITAEDLADSFGEIEAVPDIPERAEIIRILGERLI